MSSTTPVLSATATTVQQLTRTLLQGFDANKDGQLSIEEFSSFLNTFMKNMAGSAASTSHANANSAAGAGVGTAPLLGASTTYAPAYVYEQTWNPDRMLGSWDSSKWADPTHNTVKYLAGRWMAQHDPSYASMADLADYLKSEGYNVEYGGQDTMALSGKELSGPVVVDMVTSGGKWWWGVEEPTA